MTPSVAVVYELSINELFVCIAHSYTSLGNIYDTVQNPALWQKEGEDGAEGYYLPAYELKDGNSERCGRQKKAHTSSKPK